MTSRPTSFEELIADIFRAKGYEVVLTPKSKDGGFDIQAFQKTNTGTLLTLIDCKRYAANRTIGVEIVRGLFRNRERRSITSPNLAVRLEDRIYTQSLADASGIMPPKSTTPAFLAISGNGQGGRGNLAPDNKWNVLVVRTNAATSDFK